MLFAQEPATEGVLKIRRCKGNISLPKNFETEFAHLGTIAVATKKDQPVDELHVTYTRPEDIKAFQKDGKFPDGAVLVKAVRKCHKRKADDRADVLCKRRQSVVRHDQGCRGAIQRQ